jgi:diaminopimelate epimerase
MKYLLDNNLYENNEVDIETGAWIISLSLQDNTIVVDMWKPKKIKWLGIKNVRLWDKFFIKVDYKNIAFIPVSMWNPHAVIFTRYSHDDSFDIVKYWKSIEENTSIFPQKTNVEFVEIISGTEIKMRVWERWAWETLACWTWACAWVVAWILDWNLEKNKFIKVNLIWWVLEVKWSGNENDHVIIKWPAETVFEWVYFIK